MYAQENYKRTITRDDDWITIESVLAWAKRVKAQRDQAAVLNTIMELRQFNKVKVVKKPREDSTRCQLDLTAQWHLCRYCGRIPVPRQCLAYGRMCMGCGKTRHFKKVYQSRRDRAVNELEIKESQECSKGEIESLKPDSKPYQAPPMHVAYVLQKPFKEELEQLQKMDIITPLGVDEMVEWCNSFVLVPKANGKGQL